MMKIIIAILMVGPGFAGIFYASGNKMQSKHPNKHDKPLDQAEAWGRAEFLFGVQLFCAMLAFTLIEMFEG